MNIKGEDRTSGEGVNIKREEATVPVQLTQKIDPERPQRGIKIEYRKRSRKTPQYTRRFQKNLNSISNHPRTA